MLGGMKLSRAIKARTYLVDRKWADRFIPQIRGILQKVGWIVLNIEVSSQEDDNKRAVDILLKVDTGHIACRIRGAEYASYHDLTIRARRKNGVMTELEKLRKRTVRWYLYCYTDEADQNIAEWYLIDIFKMLDLGLLDSTNPTLGEKENKDGVTSFVHIPLEELTNSNCIVESGRVSNC